MFELELPKHPGFYKHTKWRDILFQVEKVVYSSPKYLKVKGHYWIIGWHKSWPVHIDTIVIKVYKTEEWERIE